MKKATGTAFESDYGFKSPSFTVDALGNIIANSISTTEPITGGGGADGTDTLTNFIITDETGSFVFTGYEVNNPTIELERGKTYTFNLSLDTLSFYVYQDNETTLYTNILDSEGNSGISAQGKQSGIIQITITSDTSDTLVYGTQDLSVRGTFSIINPTGTFGGITVSNATQSTSPTTGALKVAGGVGIAKDLYVGGNLVLEGTGDTTFDSSTNLTLGAKNRIIFTLDGTLVGEVNENGVELPLVNSTINNTVIGGTEPSTATFTTADVTTRPTTVNNVTNKAYVDQQNIALSIALGS